MIRNLRQSAGLAGLLVLAIIFSAIVLTLQLSVVAAEDETITGDVLVSTWVQRASLPGIENLVNTMNWVGRPIPMTLLTAVVALGLMSRRRYAEGLLVLPTTATHLVNALLKNAIQSPRPAAEQVRIQDHAAGFGFPSGHTMAVVVFCGVVAYLAWRLIDHRKLQVAVYTLVMLAILGIGFSRVYSGAHWPTDVLGGILWGSFYTGLLVLLFHHLQPSRSRAIAQATQLATH